MYKQDRVTKFAKFPIFCPGPNSSPQTATAPPHP